MQNQRTHGKHRTKMNASVSGQTIMKFLFVDSHGAVQRSSLPGPQPSSVLSKSTHFDLSFRWTVL